MKKLFVLIAALLFGCDSSSLLSNIDTLTCAYVPWYVADCTSTEVHDKAVSIVQNGMVEAYLYCYGNYSHPAWGHVVTATSDSYIAADFDTTYEIVRFQDGSELTHCSVNTMTSNIGSTDEMHQYFGAKFHPRSMVNYKHSCDIRMPDPSDWVFSAEDHTFTIRGPSKYGAAPEETQSFSLCQGFNTGAFD